MVMLRKPAWASILRRPDSQAAGIVSGAATPRKCERVMMRMLELLEDSWSTVVDVRFRFESMESNPFFVQICPPRDMVLLVILKLKVGDIEGMMSLCFPYFLMEPIVDKLSSQQWFASTSRKRDEDERECIVSSLGSVRIPLSLELGHTVLSLADVYALEPGDVIRLDETRESDISGYTADLTDKSHFVSNSEGEWL